MSSYKGLPIIKIDFDDTIVVGKWPLIGEPLPDALETIKALQNAGYNLILWTCRHRQHLAEAVEFLKKNDIVFDVVNTHHYNSPYSDMDEGPKPFAHYHIDDKNFGGLKPWKEVYHYFFEVKKYHEQQILE